MKPCCEIIVRDVLPVLRSAIARELADSYKLNQSEIAERLGVSKPAISQYLRSLRGRKNIFENEAIKSEVGALCQKIYSERMSTDKLVMEICSICRSITSKKLLCSSHKSIYKLENCTLCLK